MKKILAMLLALVLVFSLVACGTTNKETTTETSAETTTETKEETSAENNTTGEKPVIKYMVLSGGDDVAAIETALNARLDELNAGYHVKLIIGGWDNYSDKIGLAARGAAEDSETFDVATTASWLGNYQGLVREETLLDLTPYVNKVPKLMSTLTDASTKGLSANGGLYGIQTIIDGAPVARDYFGWNVNALEKLGLTTDDVKDLNTTEAIEPILAKFKEANPDKYPMRPSNGWVYRRVGLLTTFSDGKYEISNPYETEWFKNKFETVAKYRELGYLHPESGSELFKDQQKSGDEWLVFREEGEPNAQGIWTNSETNNNGTPTPVFAVPAAEDNVIYGGMVQGKLTSVYRHTKYPEFAVDLIEKVVTDEGIQNILAWGIEGQTYTKEADGKVKWIDGQSKWSPWQNQWTNTVRYTAVGSDSLDSPEMKAKVEAHNKGYINSVDLGFLPSPELQEKIQQAGVGSGAVEIQNGIRSAYEREIQNQKNNGIDDAIKMLKTEFEAWKAQQ